MNKLNASRNSVISRLLFRRRVMRNESELKG